jgi:hypothetical protein
VLNLIYSTKLRAQAAYPQALNKWPRAFPATWPEIQSTLVAGGFFVER